VVLTNLDSDKFLDFDYAIVSTYGDPKVAAANGKDKAGSGVDTQHPAENHTGAIVGGAVGAVVMLAIIGFLIFLIMRQRKRNQEDRIATGAGSKAYEARDGNGALGHELAPGVTMAAMASYGGARGPSPQRNYDGNGNMMGPGGYAGSLSPGSNAGIGYSPGAAAYGQQPTWAQQQAAYGQQQQQQQQGIYGQQQGGYGGQPLAPGPATPFLAGGARNGSQLEFDMPPPNYDHVFSPAMSNGGGSAVGGGSSVAGGSAVGGSVAGGGGGGRASSDAGGSSSAGGSRGPGMGRSGSRGPGMGGAMGAFPPPNPQGTRVYRELQEKGIPLGERAGVNRQADY
jgi:hypothetical protein